MTTTESGNKVSTSENPTKSVPSDAELVAFAGEEQFLLFCDKDEFVQIARAVLQRFATPAPVSGGEGEFDFPEGTQFLLVEDPDSADGVETPLEVGMAVCDRTGRKVWLHRRPPSPGSEGAGEQAGDALTESAPERVWLQVDTDGDPDDRSALLPREAWDGLSWCWESIGGQEVTYIREDLHASALAQARAERDEARAEERDADALIQRQAALLTGVVNALKGPPPPDTLWSHHDAPELAAQARAERDRLREVLGRILENEASDWKAAEEFGGYVLDDELREEARAALAKETKA